MMGCRQQGAVSAQRDDQINVPRIEALVGSLEDPGLDAGTLQRILQQIQSPEVPLMNFERSAHRWLFQQGV